MDFEQGSILEVIGYEAFFNCDNLKEAILPPTLQFIGSFAFASCDNLKDVTLPGTSLNITSGEMFEEGFVVSKEGMGMFRNCPNLRTVTFSGPVPSHIQKYYYNGTSNAAGNYIIRSLCESSSQLIHDWEFDKDSFVKFLIPSFHQI